MILFFFLRAVAGGNVTTCTRTVDTSGVFTTRFSFVLNSTTGICINNDFEFIYFLFEKFPFDSSSSLVDDVGHIFVNSSAFSDSSERLLSFEKAKTVVISASGSAVVSVSIFKSSSACQGNVLVSRSCSTKHSLSFSWRGKGELLIRPNRRACLIIDGIQTMKSADTKTKEENDDNFVIANKMGIDFQIEYFDFGDNMSVQTNYGRHFSTASSFISDKTDDPVLVTVISGACGASFFRVGHSTAGDSNSIRALATETKATSTHSRSVSSFSSNFASKSSSVSIGDDALLIFTQSPNATFSSCFSDDDSDDEKSKSDHTMMFVVGISFSIVVFSATLFVLHLRNRKARENELASLDNNNDNSNSSACRNNSLAFVAPQPEENDDNNNINENNINNICENNSVIINSINDSDEREERIKREALCAEDAYRIERGEIGARTNLEKRNSNSEESEGDWSDRSGTENQAERRKTARAPHNNEDNNESEHSDNPYSKKGYEIC